MSDQTTPVEIFTEATWEIEMLSSLLPNRRRFTRLTRSTYHDTRREPQVPPGPAAGAEGRLESGLICVSRIYT